MNSQGKNGGVQCSQWETMLADALDDELFGEARTAFDEHANRCSVCGPMLAEAREGLRLLASLEEVDPPRNLVHNILAVTSLAEPAPGAAPVAARPSRFGFRAITAGFLRSRFATSFCMAFFSLSLTLSVAGVRISDLTNAIAHPSTLRKAVVLQYTHVESSVMRYYQNMRLVYEVENRVKELRKATAPAEDKNQQEEPKKKGPNDTSGNPEQHPDYSKDWDSSTIAAASMKREGVQL